jgi:hypothetical protein
MTYVKLSQVPLGGFGIELSDDNPFDTGGSGLSATAEMIIAVGAGLVPCAWNPDKAGCAWEVLKGFVGNLLPSEAEIVLTQIATMDCATALTALGLDTTTVSLACGLGGPVWRSIQAKAQRQLEDLGFAPATPPAGERICPPHVEVVARDAAGNPSVLMVVTNTPVAADGSCPPGVPTVPGAVPPVAVPLPGEDPATGLPTTSRTFVRYKPTISAVAQTGGSRVVQKGRITGIVVDKSGASVAGATFVVWPSSKSAQTDGVRLTVGSARTGIRPFTTDATGLFTIERSPGKYSLQIDVPGYASVVVPNLDVVANTTGDLGQIEAGTGKIKTAATMDTEKTGTDTTSGSWYTSPWFIIGGLAVAGGAGYLIYRSRQK